MTADRHRWAVDTLDVEPQHRVLDAGCGAGLTMELLAAQTGAGEAVGLDRSAAMVERAARRVPGARILHGVLGAVELPGAFDRLLLSNVRNAWRDDADALRALHTVTRPDGRLLVVQDDGTDLAPLERRLAEAGWRDLRRVGGAGAAGVLATA